ncbi:ABC transporter ATP-binding protein [Aeromicrobium sp. 50.2.37]|uniref:ABC transporter ATP-binding protein n=1 Tax=Aeromicrobium sp. 50.2.37 TaxID=2969305 RepID=UPI0021505AD3|nr:ABC transporter ATP-binding protein [Aeromicrobium sp. 50.2.37]MCR4512825.1 ABC transporter ATP-binding protein [Aeromicrobium sp. 50.2.37]
MTAQPTDSPASSSTSAERLAAPVARLRDVHQSYGRSLALAGAALEVAPGERVAVTGPSGSGKSTLLLCLAGVLRPQSGDVEVVGRDLSTLDDAARTRLRRREIGLVLQFGQLVPELTAVQNVAFPLLLESSGRAEAEAAAVHWLDRLGVADLAGERPGALSGGEQQRVAIARALVTSPALVLADEPTGALDTVTAEEVLAVMRDAASASGAALVVVTHDNRVAASLDREVVLRDGRVVGDEGSR